MSDNTPVELPKPCPSPSPIVSAAAVAAAAAAATTAKLKGIYRCCVPTIQNFFIF